MHFPTNLYSLLFLLPFALSHVSLYQPNIYAKDIKSDPNIIRMQFQANLELSLIAFLLTAHHLHFLPNQNLEAAGL